MRRCRLGANRLEDETAWITEYRQALEGRARSLRDLEQSYWEQFLRVVEVLERDGRGLNLTREVRDGIRHHTGDGRPITLEGQIVRLVDRIAYVNHDIDDAVRAGIISEDDLPRPEIAVLGGSTSDRITRLVSDIVTTSADADEISQSDEVGEAFRSLRGFMFDEVYLASPAADEADRARYVVQALVRAYLDDPSLLPPGGDDDPVTRVTDHVSGMTDRYAVRLFERHEHDDLGLRAGSGITVVPPGGGA